MFQRPERQLFCNTVLEEAAFGAARCFADEDKARKFACEELERFDIDKGLWDRNPLELSGGLRRRVAVAGAVAMHPDVLALDEPMAGLDPHSRERFRSELKSLQRERGCSIVMVSHRMEDLALLADRIAVMDSGSILFCGMPRDVFPRVIQMKELGCGVPLATALTHRLIEGGLLPANALAIDDAGASDAIAEACGLGQPCSPSLGSMEG